MTVATAPLSLMADKGPAEGPSARTFPPAHGNTAATQTFLAERTRFPVFKNSVPGSGVRTSPSSGGPR